MSMLIRQLNNDQPLSQLYVFQILWLKIPK